MRSYPTRETALEVLTAPVNPEDSPRYWHGLVDALADALGTSVGVLNAIAAGNVDATLTVHPVLAVQQP